MCAAIPDAACRNVIVQDREASRRAVEYLGALGHRRFGYISGTPGSMIEAERYGGFRKGSAAARAERGRISCAGKGPSSSRPGSPQPSRSCGWRIGRPGSSPPATRARSASSRRVRAERVRVPQDVSVIGFDGIEFSDYSEPTLTTFRQPLHELGRVGADVLLKLIRGELKSEEWHIRLPLTLLERETTGPVLHKDYKSLRRSIF